MKQKCMQPEKLCDVKTCRKNLFLLKSKIFQTVRPNRAQLHTYIISLRHLLVTHLQESYDLIAHCVTPLSFTGNLLFNSLCLDPHLTPTFLKLFSTLCV